MKSVIAEPVKVLLLALYTLASYLVPKDRRLLVFGGSFEGNAKSIYHYCKQTLPRHRTIWIAHVELEDVPQAVGDDFVPQWSLASIWLVLRARFLFINHQASEISLFPLIGRFSIVQLWHGTPIKKILFDAPEWSVLKSRISTAMARLEFRNYAIVATTSELAGRCME